MTKIVKYNYIKIKTFGQIVKENRENAGQPLRKVAAYLDIDQAILSKIEHGKRKATRDQVLKLAEYFETEKESLLISWLSDKILYEVGNEDLAKEALKVAEQKLNYHSK